MNTIDVELIDLVLSLTVIAVNVLLFVLLKRGRYKNSPAVWIRNTAPCHAIIWVAGVVALIWLIRLDIHPIANLLLRGGAVMVSLSSIALVMWVAVKE